jgi:hypothetical protein
MHCRILLLAVCFLQSSTFLHISKVSHQQGFDSLNFWAIKIELFKVLDYRWSTFNEQRLYILIKQITKVISFNKL